MQLSPNESLSRRTDGGHQHEDAHRLRRMLDRARKHLNAQRVLAHFKDAEDADEPNRAHESDAADIGVAEARLGERWRLPWGDRPFPSLRRHHC